METIGDRIKELRKENRLTQAELAEKSGLSLMSIRRYEGGDRVPKLDSIEKISKALNASIFDIFQIHHYEDLYALKDDEQYREYLSLMDKTDEAYHAEQMAEFEKIKKKSDEDFARRQKEFDDFESKQNEEYEKYVSESYDRTKKILQCLGFKMRKPPIGYSEDEYIEIFINGDYLLLGIDAISRLYDSVEDYARSLIFEAKYYTDKNMGSSSVHDLESKDD